MSQSIFEQYEIFKTMHPMKVQIMKELAENMKGKQMKDAAPYIMGATNRLKQNNLSFTPEETAVLIEILSQGMSPQEKAKVEMMKNFMTKKKRG